MASAYLNPAGEAAAAVCATTTTTATAQAALRAAGVITWPWHVVLRPLWVGPAVVVAGACAFVLVVVAHMLAAEALEGAAGIYRKFRNYTRTERKSA